MSYLEKSLGKLGKVTLGSGGYQDAMFGYTFPLEGEKGWSSDFWGVWSYRPQSAEWTEESRRKKLGAIQERVMKLMGEAKVNDIRELQGVAIEITWLDQRLQSWRILTEVL